MAANIYLFQIEVLKFELVELDFLYPSEGIHRPGCQVCHAVITVTVLAYYINCCHMGPGRQACHSAMRCLEGDMMAKFEALHTLNKDGIILAVIDVLQIIHAAVVSYVRSSLKTVVRRPKHAPYHGNKEAETGIYIRGKIREAS